jgi:ornithine cyclodeaminase/alanine dehydrogenase-like protein (mu-crystallin family)
VSTLHYVNEAEIRALELTPKEIREAVADALRQRAAGTASLVPKIGIYPPAGGLFHAMPAAIDGLAIVKWLTAGARRRPGDPELRATILATDPITGDLIAALDAAYLTGLRTAAVTAIAAQCVVSPQARRIAFIGAGLQARTHLDALADVLPLREATVLSSGPSSADRFRDELRARGIDARSVSDAHEAVQDADVVVTAVPFMQAVAPSIDARWLAPRAFAVAVDLGRAWIASTYTAFDRILTDDRAHTEAFLSSGLVPSPGPIDTDLPALLTRPAQNRDASGRTLFFAPGIALADAAMALLVLRRLSLVDPGTVTVERG